MNVLNEPDILRQLRLGNVDAYLHLYDQYHTLVYGWVLRFVKVPAYAEDIVQDVFLKIWEVRHRLNPEQSFPAYLYKISRNKTFSFLKKTASDEKTRLQVMQRLSELAESPYQQALWNQYQQMLAVAVKQLPYQRQRVFTLCRQEGKSYDEAAQELGISRNTVKEHMVMALKDIKAYFYRHGDLSLAILLLLHRH
ncbi:RNA polymerase sigma factor [Chitinophaga japonensis]|uniref:RNA polymerase sigma factor n=1 Tax=Chitinophaga japonensis TaxID=104662 RepID=A0A562T4P4_CHIJA|nr:RNA polymerase sigma-70 factor [Chitinophaga japonensis]TWI88248.1 RNA polymerase sigma-70 factor (ECF subfamily) [Chitinophaga japonensis]